MAFLIFCPAVHARHVFWTEAQSNWHETRSESWPLETIRWTAYDVTIKAYPVEPNPYSQVETIAAGIPDLHDPVISGNDIYFFSTDGLAKIRTDGTGYQVINSDWLLRIWVPLPESELMEESAAYGTIDPGNSLVFGSGYHGVWAADYDQVPAVNYGAGGVDEWPCWFWGGDLDTPLIAVSSNWVYAAGVLLNDQGQAQAHGLARWRVGNPADTQIWSAPQITHLAVDDATVYYTTPAGEIWKFDPSHDSSPGTLLLGGGGTIEDIETDGQGLYWVANGMITCSDLDGGNVRDLHSVQSDGPVYLAVGEYEAPTVYVLAAGVDWADWPAAELGVSGVKGALGASLVRQSFEKLATDYQQQWNALPDGEQKAKLRRSFNTQRVSLVGGSGNLKAAIQSISEIVKKNDTFILYLYTHGNLHLFQNSEPPRWVTRPYVDAAGSRRLWRGQETGDEYAVVSISGWIDVPGSGGLMSEPVGDFIHDNELRSWFVNGPIPGNLHGTDWFQVNKLFIIEACFSGGFADPEDGLADMSKTAYILSPPGERLYADVARGLGLLGQGLAGVNNRLYTSDGLSIEQKVTLLDYVTDVKLNTQIVVEANGNEGILLGYDPGLWGEVFQDITQDLFWGASDDFTLFGDVDDPSTASSAGIPDQDLVDVPDLTGLTAQQAQGSLDSAGLVLGDVIHRNDPGVPAGHVIEQSPYPGSAVQVGSHVEIVLSDGPAGQQEDVADKVSVRYATGSYNRQTKCLGISATITNASEQTLKGPFHLVIESITEAAVTVANPSGSTAQNRPYLDLTASIGEDGLRPGESVVCVVQFHDPSNVRFNFTAGVRAVVSQTQ